MREYIFHGKRKDNGEWIEGYYVKVEKLDKSGYEHFIIEEDANGSSHLVVPESVGQYTGMNDKNGRKIFEGDIVQYQTYDDFDCQSVVRFGVYTQDGSGGEYAGNRCLGFYVDVDNFTCPDWCENDPSCFSGYLYQQNINEVATDCEVIGTVFENKDLLEG